jgi:hypothetical protein
MTLLNFREKRQVLFSLIKSNEETIKFTETNYKSIFHDLNLDAVRNYLIALSQRGLIKFEVYANDGYAAEFTISNINRKKIEEELFTIKHRYGSSNNKKVLVLVMLLFAVLITLSMTYSLFFSPHSMLKEYFSVLMSLLLTLITFLITSVLRKERDVNEITQYSEKLKRTIIESNYKGTKEKGNDASTKKNDENDALNLMLVNMAEIKAYYTLSKTQAKDSFRLSVWMCILGFILLVAAVVLPFLTSGKYEVSIITAIGGAIVEIIAGTSLFVYKNSLLQLNHYYESLHDNEKFLSTVNLVRKLSQEKQDDMYIEIIRSCIKDIEKKQL